MIRCPQCGADAGRESVDRCPACGADLPAAPPREAITAAPAADRFPAEPEWDEPDLRISPRQVYARRLASSTLLAVCLTYVICGGLSLFIIENRNAGGDVLLFAAAELTVLALIYGGLAWWARVHPFPAAATGLTIYLLYHCGTALIAPKTLVAGIILKVILLVALVKAVAGCWPTADDGEV